MIASRASLPDQAFWVRRSGGLERPPRPAGALPSAEARTACGPPPTSDLGEGGEALVPPPPSVVIRPMASPRGAGVGTKWSSRPGHEPRVLQHAQVLDDGLAGDRQLRGQLGRGRGPALGDRLEQPAPRRVGERGEDVGARDGPAHPQASAMGAVTGCSVTEMRVPPTAGVRMTSTRGERILARDQLLPDGTRVFVDLFAGRGTPHPAPKPSRSYTQVGAWKCFNGMGIWECSRSRGRRTSSRPRSSGSRRGRSRGVGSRA